MSIMAANQVSTFMRTTLNIEPTRANNHSRLRQAIIAQGINDFDTMHRHHEDRLTAVFQTVRRPGGMMVDPNHPGQQIRATGHNLTADHELGIRKMVFAKRYYWMVQRDLIH